MLVLMPKTVDHRQPIVHHQLRSLGCLSDGTVVGVAEFPLSHLTTSSILFFVGKILLHSIALRNFAEKDQKMIQIHIS